MAKKVASPSQFPAKLLVGFTNEQMADLDEWRRQQPDLPSRSEALRRILQDRLAADRTKTSKRKG
jgi:hypothetical protein